MLPAGGACTGAAGQRVSKLLSCGLSLSVAASSPSSTTPSSIASSASGGWLSLMKNPCQVHECRRESGAELIRPRGNETPVEVDGVLHDSERLFALPEAEQRAGQSLQASASRGSNRSGSCAASRREIAIACRLLPSVLGLLEGEETSRPFVPAGREDNIAFDAGWRLEDPLDELGASRLPRARAERLSEMEDDRIARAVKRWISRPLQHVSEDDAERVPRLLRDLHRDP